MKTNTTLKFLRYFVQLDRERGFTWTGLSVILFLVGVFVVIAPHVLVSKSNPDGCLPPGSEARQNIGAMNRSQQAYFLDQNQFTNSFQELGVGIKNQTERYSYSIRKKDKYVIHYATAKLDSLKSYVGGVYRASEKIEGIPEEMTHTILCETKFASRTQAADPIYQNGVLTCDPSQIDPSK